MSERLDRIGVAMGLINTLAAVSHVKILSRGGSNLIKSDDTSALLRAALSHKVVVIGIEGFHIVDDKLIPDMNAIADFSAFSNLLSDNLQRSIDSASAF